MDAANLNQSGTLWLLSLSYPPASAGGSVGVGASVGVGRSVGVGVGFRVAPAGVGALERERVGGSVGGVVGGSDGGDVVGDGVGAFVGEYVGAKVIVGAKLSGIPSKSNWARIDAGIHPTATHQRMEKRRRIVRVLW